MGEVLDALAGLALWLLLALYVVIPLTPVLIIMQLLKLGERLVYKWRYGCVMVQTEDMIWIEENPKNRPIINGVLLMKGTVELEEVRSILKEKLVDVTKNGKPRYPKARTFVREGHFNFYWMEDQTFDMSNHVFEPSHTSINSVDELQQHISSLVTEPLPYEVHPPWQMLVLPCQLEGETKTALLWRCHHCVADGVSLANFLVNSVPDQPIDDNNQVNSPQHAQHTHMKLSTTTRFLLTMKGMMLLPMQVIRMLWLIPTDTSPWHKSVDGKKRVAWSQQLDFQTIRDFKSKAGVTVNEALLGTLALCLQRQIPTEGQEGIDQLICCLPVSTRSSKDDSVDFSNKFGVVYLTLPMKSNDISSAVLSTRKEVTRVKTSGEPFACRVMICLSGLFLPTCIRYYLFKKLSCKSSAIATSLPGPQSNISIGGYEVEMLSFWSPQRNDIGMSVSFITYNNKLVMGLLMDVALPCEPDDILSAYQKMYSELSEHSSADE